MDAGLLDVLHHAADDDRAGLVGDDVDVDLDRVGEELVDQQREADGRASSSPRRAADARARARSSPRGRARRRRAPSRGRRARSSAAPSPGSRSRAATARASSRLRAMPQRGARSAELRSAPRRTARDPRRDRSRRRCVPRIGTPACASGTASLSGVWPPNCTITPHGFSTSQISSTSSSVSGSKYSRSRRVVVGRHRLGVAVDHDRLDALLAQRHRRVHAAVVELDALADAVRPAAEDDHLAACRWAAPRTRPRTSSTGTACATRTRRRRCRRACRPGACRRRGAPRAPRPRSRR